MSKKCYRFFGGMISMQEKWLNKMADQGYRLVRTEKLLYEFEESGSEKYQYRVEYRGNKSQASAEDYRNFLEDMGYRTFYKNININYNVGKVIWRPWAEKGGRISTNETTLNKELLIIEKLYDGKPFEIYTTLEDKIKYCLSIRRPWLFMFVFFGILAIVLRAWVWLIVAALGAIGLIMCQIKLIKLRKQAKLKE